MNYLSNEQIRLRAVEPEDLDFMYAVENDPRHWMVSGVTEPYSRYTLRQYIETTQNDLYMDRQLRLVIVSRQGGSPIGAVDLSDYDPYHQRAAVGIVVEASSRCQSYGTQALTLLCEYSFGYLHLHQLYAYVAADNIASLSLFRKCGFECSGELKDWLRTSAQTYQTVYILQKTTPY